MRQFESHSGLCVFMLHFEWRFPKERAAQDPEVRKDLTLEAARLKQGLPRYNMDGTSKGDLSQRQNSESPALDRSLVVSLFQM